MTTNPYIDHWTANVEQDLLENLIIESIQFNGIDLHYIPRTLNNLDEIWEEDAISTYSNNYTIEGYIENIEGYGGDQTFLSKFGLEVRDSVNFVISKSRFEEVLGDLRSRPQEGDLIHFPLGDRIFRIMYVDHREQFYQHGKLYTYRLKCEVMENASERYNTGIQAVDNAAATWTQDELFANNSSYNHPFDASADNEEIDIQANNLIDFTDENPWGGY